MEAEREVPALGQFGRRHLEGRGRRGKLGVGGSRPHGEGESERRARGGPAPRRPEKTRDDERGERADEQAHAERRRRVAELDPVAPGRQPDGAQGMVGAPQRLLGAVDPHLPAREPRVGQDEVGGDRGRGVEHHVVRSVAPDLHAAGLGGPARRRHAVAPRDDDLLLHVERALLEKTQRRGVVEARPGPRHQERARQRVVVPIDDGVGPLVFEDQVRGRARRAGRPHHIADPEQVEHGRRDPRRRAERAAGRGVDRPDGVGQLLDAKGRHAVVAADLVEPEDGPEVRRAEPGAEEHARVVARRPLAEVPHGRWRAQVEEPGVDDGVVGGGDGQEAGELDRRERGPEAGRRAGRPEQAQQ